MLKNSDLSASSPTMVIVSERRRLEDSVRGPALEHLRHFQGTVAAYFHDRLSAITLFGSRARGDAQPGSDYDVAVFLKNARNLRQDGQILSDLAYPHILSGIHIRPIPLPDNYLEIDQPGTLALRIARDGISIR
jgi:hypothetical protein